MSSISSGTTTTTALVQTADTSGVLQLQTNGGTTAITIDNSQNVGVGVTPSAWISTAKAFQINGGYVGSIWTTASGQFQIGNNVYTNSGGNDTYISTNYAAKYNISSTGQHQWYNAPSGTAGNAITFTQAMTLDSSSNLLLGQTVRGNVDANSFEFDVSNGIAYFQHITGTGTGAAYTSFNYGATKIGSITQAGTTAVLYNTTSDYRLKSNVVPVTTGLSVINQLNPVNFTWISDNESDTGFLAHEFQTVIPRAVTGTKDATIEEEYEVTPAVKDEQGNITTPAVMGTRTVPVYQQMDNSGAVPYLVAAIKELSAQVTTLQTQVTALKG